MSSILHTKTRYSLSTTVVNIIFPEMQRKNPLTHSFPLNWRLRLTAVRAQNDAGGIVLLCAQPSGALWRVFLKSTIGVTLVQSKRGVYEHNTRLYKPPLNAQAAWPTKPTILEYSNRGACFFCPSGGL